MTRLFPMTLAAVCMAAVASVSPASAQVTPAAGYTPPDDTPSIKLGATIFADYTFQAAPEITDTDGNTVHSNSFNTTRTYINITGNISHRISFRITPDISRESGAGASLAGSQEFRLKYGYVQFNLDDWMPKGSWIRMGVHHTPLIDYQEGIYRYRFQGSIFPERSGYLSSSDAGISLHANFPQNYGDVHVGVYNGESYSKAEANNQKSFQIRVSVRPAPRVPNAKGLRLTVFYDKDEYVVSAPRDRFLAGASYEHKYANLGVDYMNAKDQSSTTKAEVDGSGYSFWFTPKTTKGWEGLFRFDNLKANKDLSGRRKIAIAGVSYWFPHQGNVATALLFDYEQYTYSGAPPQPKQQRVFVHALVNF